MAAILHARDPRMWTFLTGDTGDLAAPAVDDATRAATPSATPTADVDSKAKQQQLTHGDDPPDKPGPPTLTDEDEAEWASAEREFQVLTDKAELMSPEMFLYWRMMGWQMAQSDSALLHRGNKHVLFRQLFESPSEYRGKLIWLKLRRASPRWSPR